MKRKYKAYLKLNIMSLFFIAVSLISVTLAWFAYSGIINVKTEVDVRAWYIEFDKDGESISNNVVLSLSEIYPGMETVTESVNVKNLGDSDAEIRYAIKSARILNDTYEVDGVNVVSETLEDSLSHDYPFHVNISLEKDFARAKVGESKINISVSWPLDSGTDEIDSDWGMRAYNFQKAEEQLHEEDNTYNPRNTIKIVINLSADQYTENPNAVDMDFYEGRFIMYDVVANKSCTEISSTCLRTHVISRNSKISDTTVSLLPDFLYDYGKTTYDNYSTALSTVTSGWVVPTRTLTANDLLNIVSNDVINSYLVRPNLSNLIIGELKYPNRIQTELNKAIIASGYYTYNIEKYDYLDTNSCYWTSTNYNNDKGFALVNHNQTTGKIYGENKTTNCDVVPVIEALKVNID